MIKKITFEMVGNLCPVVWKNFYKFFELLVLAIFPNFLKVILDSLVPTVAHFRVAAWKMLCDYVPFHSVLFNQAVENSVFFLCPDFLIVVVVHILKVLHRDIQVHGLVLLYLDS